MLSFVAQRVVKGVIVLLAIVVLNFFLIRLAPGDPAVVMAGEAGASDQVFVEQLREKFGLDKPLPEQLFIYVKGIVTLDLGFSFRQQAPVVEADRRAAAGDTAADADRLCDLARARRSLRHLRRALCRNLPRHRDHRVRADLLRHADLLGRR